MREYDALRGKNGKLEKVFAALGDVPNVNYKKIQRLEWQTVADAKAITRLATVAKCHRSNYLRVTAKNGKLRRRVDDSEEKNFEAGASA